jgi:proline iminopeptidase
MQGDRTDHVASADGNDGTDEALAPGHHRVRLAGVDIAYEVRGSGPVLVAHAGGPGSHPQYMRMPEVERFATVVYVDPVGAGASGLMPGGDYSVETYAELARLLITTLPGGTAHFLGHSHGGMVALQLALDHPEVLQSVIVHSGLATNRRIGEVASRRVAAFVARFPDDPEARDAQAAWDELAELDDATADPEVEAAVVRRLRPAYIGHPREQADVLRFIQANPRRTDPDRLPDGPWDVRPLLPRIAVPLAVFVGRHDFIAGAEHAVEIWQDVPGSRLVTFEDSGHFAHLEEPLQFAAAVRSFLDSTRRTGAVPLSRDQLPAPVLAHLDAVRALDAPAILGTFTDDALVNDLGREFLGREALGPWIDQEYLTLQLTMEFVEAFAHDDVVVLRARYDGTFDRAALGLPDEIVLTSYIVLREDRIATMIVSRTAGRQAAS